MKKKFRHILKAVAKDGELSVEEAISRLSTNENSHTDLYPLSLLIEEGFLGLTFTPGQILGAERMREYSLAITLHMLRLPKNENGIVEYNGITSEGSLNAKDEKVFIKAKGQLHLDEYARKWEERAVYVLLGVFVAIGTQYLRQTLGLG
ncbi:hypothetical protein SAMN05216227_103611 [Pseudorhodobacter antarcticus]|uniref:Uncharacterized protein n=1 Tax=Pseudorhodobacter antarcticus TaxID=1077947 RepID=A0A1H8KX26_9RHOB|nr:hypothetical protein [Pseudorhodobacter antarcticus]SEN97423.1 hypothetical protein SAMN05216227_103611 [Pseudorhodobacter antarcticus]